MGIKKISSLLLVLFLVGCSSISAPLSTPTLPESTSTVTLLPTNTPEPTKTLLPSPTYEFVHVVDEITYNRSMEAFEFSENCPKVCFLGIKPSVTTPAEALHLLKNSPDIDQTKIYVLSSDGLTLKKDLDEASIVLKKGDILEAPWTPTNDKEFGDYIHLSATNNLIDYLDARPILTTIQDFINVIGKPDGISVHGEMPPDAPYWISYVIYYSKWKLIIQVFIASIDGPKADDEVHTIFLNQEINAADFRPWKGYGKMKEYMTTEQLNEYEHYTK